MTSLGLGERGGPAHRHSYKYTADAYERYRDPMLRGLGDSEALPGFGENFPCRKWPRACAQQLSPCFAW